MSNWKYIPADMVYHNYGQPPKVWEKMQDDYRKHLEKNPICEICKNNPSVRITPLGKIKAACLNCVEQQRKELELQYLISD